MTTVIWTKGKLASDSRRVRGGIISNATVRKILFPEVGEEWKIMGQRVIAFGRAGQPGCELFIKEALQSKEGITHRTELKIATKMSFSAIVIDEFHNGWSIQGSYKQGANVPDTFNVTRCYVPFGIGSGGIHAEAALRLGKGAKGAIKLAKDMDPHTGGKIQVFKLPKAVKKQPPPKPEKDD
jgi:hypothetical protein